MSILLACLPATRVAPCSARQRAGLRTSGPSMHRRRRSAWGAALVGGSSATLLGDRCFRGGGGVQQREPRRAGSPSRPWNGSSKARTRARSGTAGVTTLLVDVRSQPYIVGDGARSQYVRCVIINSTTFPGSCDEAAFDAAHDDAVAEGHSWKMPLGARSPATPAGSSEPQTGADVASAFGPGFPHTNYSRTATYAAGSQRVPRARLRLWPCSPPPYSSACRAAAAPWSG